MTDAPRILVFTDPDTGTCSWKLDQKGARWNGGCRSIYEVSARTRDLPVPYPRDIVFVQEKA